jgi:hypothetical protein
MVGVPKHKKAPTAHDVSQGLVLDEPFRHGQVYPHLVIVDDTVLLPA